MENEEVIEMKDRDESQSSVKQEICDAYRNMRISIRSLPDSEQLKAINDFRCGNWRKWSNNNNEK